MPYEIWCCRAAFRCPPLRKRQRFDTTKFSKTTPSVVLAVRICNGYHGRLDSANLSKANTIHFRKRAAQRSPHVRKTQWFNSTNYSCGTLSGNSFCFRYDFCVLSIKHLSCNFSRLKQRISAEVLRISFKYMLGCTLDSWGFSLSKAPTGVLVEFTKSTTLYV